MKFKDLSVKRLFGWLTLGLFLSMCGIIIALFLMTKQTAVLLTGGAMMTFTILGLFILTQEVGKRLLQLTDTLCQT